MPRGAHRRTTRDGWIGRLDEGHMILGEFPCVSVMYRNRNYASLDLLPFFFFWLNPIMLLLSRGGNLRKCKNGARGQLISLM
ncbi:hypothetical protein BCR43DRAFT_352341 [Syncephalastrum racemosum]|uniref:Uncharacterized protein n=1 Tax=Syncephalastrum racemosum TaxID=13706 RepID=A0A1X2H696_SYNRA|nr:hypothetical protein BCR43DRAFT_352341 [Syncephalastrum racemosum]